MEYSSVQSKFRKYLKERPVSLIEAAECRHAAVCLALLMTENGPDIILQVRSSKLEEQPGDKEEPEVHEISLEVKEPEDFPFEKICGGRKYGWRKRTEKVYFYEYQQYCIWGITAKLIHSFTEICKKRFL